MDNISGEETNPNSINVEGTFQKASEDRVPNEVQANKQGIPEITIQEIIPEIKEIPITGPPKREISKGSFYNSQKFNKDTLEKFRGDKSEFGEENKDNDRVENPQSSPVLKIGDKLLFLKKGEFIPEKDASTPSPVITIIGAEGLQRGFEESLESHDKIVAVSTEIKDDNDLKEAEEDDIESADSTNIFSVVKRNSSKDDGTTRIIEVSDYVTEKKPTYYIEEAIVNRIKNIATQESPVATTVETVLINKLVDDEAKGNDGLTSVDVDNTTIDIAVEMPTTSIYNESVTFLSHSSHGSSSSIVSPLPNSSTISSLSPLSPSNFSSSLLPSSIDSFSSTTSSPCNSSSLPTSPCDSSFLPSASSSFSTSSSSSQSSSFPYMFSTLSPNPNLSVPFQPESKNPPQVESNITETFSFESKEPDVTTSTLVSTDVKIEDESRDEIMDQNPEYPPIPDVMVSPHEVFTEIEVSQMKRTTLRPETVATSLIKEEEIGGTTEKVLRIKEETDKIEVTNEESKDIEEQVQRGSNKQNTTEENITGQEILKEETFGENKTEQKVNGLETPDSKIIDQKIVDQQITDQDSIPHADDATTESSGAKILPEVLILTSNKTVPKNTTHLDWLKEENVPQLVNEKAKLPDSLLQEVVESDIDNLKEYTTESDTITTEKFLNKKSEDAAEEQDKINPEEEVSGKTNQSEIITKLDVVTDTILNPVVNYDKIIDSNPFTQNHMSSLNDEGKINAEVTSIQTVSAEEMSASFDDKRSTETVEMTNSESSSRELTTPSTENKSPVSIEDASVESTDFLSKEESPKIQSSKEDVSKEESSKMQASKEITTKEKDSKEKSSINTSSEEQAAKEVLIMGNESKTKSFEEELQIKTPYPNKFDPSEMVEIIPGHSIENLTKIDQNKPTTPKQFFSKDVEILKPETSTLSETTNEKTKSEKIKVKRENSSTEDIFKQLNEELEREENPEKFALPKEQEDEEAEKIFKQLLEETNTPASMKISNRKESKTQSKDSDALRRVSDAITKFSLKDNRNSLDASILGVLRDFFSAQYKSYSQDRN